MLEILKPYRIGIFLLVGLLIHLVLYLKNGYFAFKNQLLQMRNAELLQERNQAINSTFNAEYKELKSDPHNKLVPNDAIYKTAIARTAAKFYLSIRTINHILSTPQVQTI